MTWNWEDAIKRNRTDLAKIIAGLFVLAGWIPGGERPTFICRTARNELARLLRVSEAALRRLIVITATVRKYDGKPKKTASRPLPDFSKFGQGKGNRAPVFNLIDPRKPIRFVDEESFYGKVSNGPEPRIWTIEEPAPMVVHVLRQAQDEGVLWNHPPSVAGQQEATRGVAPSGTKEIPDALAEYKQTTQGEEVKNPASLLRRLAALDHALKTLPRQARRMVRLIKTRYSARSGPGRVPPIKIGPPPGHREHPKHEADHVLRECHGLVCDLRGIP